MSKKKEYPKTFVAKNGQKLIAHNETQEAAFRKFDLEEETKKK